MYGFNTVDGFMNVNQSLEEMIKYLANEPSVGLFFVQQHVQNTVPNLLNLKDKVAERSREMTLHTVDLEESILAVRSMSECGLPIADDMIKDISRSLHLMSTSLPRRGLIQNTGWDDMATIDRRTSPLSSYSSGSTLQDDLTSRSYISSVLNSAKQKAASLRWSQLDSTSKEQEFDRSKPYNLVPSVAVSSISSLPDTMTAEPPVSCQTEDRRFARQETPAGSSSSHYITYTVDNYEQFTSEREAKLEKWLEE